MPKTDNPVGPGFELRLRAALDRVQPPHSPPRYRSVTGLGGLRTAAWRAAPLAVVAVIGLLLTAYAATGSPNPVIWTQNAASAINSITHGPEASPTAEPPSAPVQEPPRRSSQPPSEQEKPEAPERSDTEPMDPGDDSHKHEAERSSRDSNKD